MQAAVDMAGVVRSCQQTLLLLDEDGLALKRCVRVCGCVGWGGGETGEGDVSVCVCVCVGASASVCALPASHLFPPPTPFEPLNPQPSNPEPPHPEPSTLNPKPDTLTLTLSPTPQTLNPPPTPSTWMLYEAFLAAMETHGAAPRATAKVGVSSPDTRPSLADILQQQQQLGDYRSSFAALPSMASLASLAPSSASVGSGARGAGGPGGGGEGAARATDAAALLGVQGAGKLVVLAQGVVWNSLLQEAYRGLEVCGERGAKGRRFRVWGLGMGFRTTPSHATPLLCPFPSHQHRHHSQPHHHNNNCLHHPQGGPHHHR